MRMCGDQDYDRVGGYPFFHYYTGFEPLARATPHLTDESILGDVLGAAQLTIPSRIRLSKLQENESLIPRSSRGVTRASDPEPLLEKKKKWTSPLHRSLGRFQNLSVQRCGRGF